MSFYDHAGLRTITDGLPDLDPPTGPPSTDGTSSGMDNNAFSNLVSIRVNTEFSAKNFYNLGIQQKLTSLDYIIRILHQSPSLTYISIPERFLLQKRSQFLSLLAHKLPFVNQLIVQGNRVEPDIGFEFLRVCFNHPRLVNLYCQFCIWESDGDNTQLESFLATLDAEAIDKPAMRTRIKSLVLPELSGGYPIDFICALLGSHLPCLERFHVPRIKVIKNSEDTSYLDTPQELIQDTVAKKCPDLQHVECTSWPGDNENTREVVKGVIMGCKEQGLRSFRGLSFDDTENDTEDQSIMITLVDYHSNTLEEVELLKCREVYSQDLAYLFTKCRNLRRVKVEPGNVGGISMGDCAISFEDVAFEEWACCNLRELHLVLAKPYFDYFEVPEGESGGGNDEQDDSEEAAEAEEERRRLRLEEHETWVIELAGIVYGQIGRLVKLETLFLGAKASAKRTQDFTGDLTLEYGWLAELAGLKELKHFGMSTDLWLNIGLAEVEFMDANWPKLKRISFDYGPSEDTVKEPHWQWLQKRRPYLQYGEL
ncbi:hypothetical protein BGX31_009155, partial [Mortierella sp. GBA43]